MLPLLIPLMERFALSYLMAAKELFFSMLPTKCDHYHFHIPFYYYQWQIIGCILVWKLLFILSPLYEMHTCFTNSPALLQSLIATTGWSQPRVSSPISIASAYKRSASSYLPCHETCRKPTARGCLGKYTVLPQIGRTLCIFCSLACFSNNPALLWRT